MILKQHFMMMMILNILVTISVLLIMMMVNVAVIWVHIICVCVCCCKTSLCFSDPKSTVPDQQQNLNKDNEVEIKPASFWDMYDPINQLYLELGTVMLSVGVKLSFQFI